MLLGLSAWWLSRKGIGVLDALGELADATGVLEVDDPVLPKQHVAVLAAARDIHRREEARRFHRAERRRLRHERAWRGRIGSRRSTRARCAGRTTGTAERYHGEHLTLDKRT